MEVESIMRSKGIFSAVLLVLLLTACSVRIGTKDKGEKYDRNTVVLNQDGSVSEYIRESFPDKYSVEDLIASMDQEIMAYNEATSPDSVTRQEPVVREGMIRLEMSYRTVGDYALFNEGRMEVKEYVPGDGTIPDGDKAIEAASGATVKTEDIRVEGARVCMMYCPYDLYVNGRILYYSDGIRLEGDNHVSMENVDRGYVIYELTK